MEQQDIFYRKSDYIETANNNKVSRQSVLCGSQNIVLGGAGIFYVLVVIILIYRCKIILAAHGKTIIQNECIIRGDLANVRFGRQCVIGSKSVIRPPFKKFTKGVAFFPFQMGDHVMVGEGSIVNAASIGSYVNIGKNVVIGRRSFIKDCSAIADNSVLPPETVVPPFTLWAGNPAKIVAELPESTQDIMVDLTRGYFHHFVGR